MHKGLHIPLYVLILPGIFLSIVACRDYGSPGDIYNNVMRDIVTYEGISDGGVSLFSYQAHDDSPVITLEAGNYTDTLWTKGMRIMIQYYELEPLSGNSTSQIQLTGLIPTLWDSLRYASPRKLQQLTSNPIKLNSIWRSGKYINVNTLLQTTDSTRLVALLVNSEELTNNTHTKVKATFIDDILGRPAFFYRQAYMSFDTEPLWATFPDCDTLEIEVSDLRFPNVKSYTFSRPKGL